MCSHALNSSILKRAQTGGMIDAAVHDLRGWTHDTHHSVDDRPYGGGPGMVMRPEPVFEAVEAIEAQRHAPGEPRTRSRCQVVLMAPTGVPLSQAVAKELSAYEHLLTLCGHYEGVDERIRMALVDREISIGDYVLTGGELPAMVLIDAVARLIPGVLGHPDATREESFTNGLLEYPHYTRPPVFRGMEVPVVLRSGDHHQIARWRKLKAVARTLTHRPDLIQAGPRNHQESRE